MMTTLDNLKNSGTLLDCIQENTHLTNVEMLNVL